MYMYMYVYTHVMQNASTGWMPKKLSSKPSTACM